MCERDVQVNVILYTKHLRKMSLAPQKMLEGCQSVIKFYISVCGLSYPIEIISIIHNGKVILNPKCFGFTGNSGRTLEMHYRSKAFIIRLVTRLKRLSVKIHELRFNTDSDKHAAFEYL